MEVGKEGVRDLRGCRAEGAVVFPGDRFGAYRVDVLTRGFVNGTAGAVGEDHPQ